MLSPERHQNSVAEIVSFLEDLEPPPDFREEFAHLELRRLLVALVLTSRGTEEALDLVGGHHFRLVPMEEPDRRPNDFHLGTHLPLDDNGLRPRKGERVLLHHQLGIVLGRSSPQVDKAKVDIRALDGTPRQVPESNIDPRDHLLPGEGPGYRERDSARANAFEKFSNINVSTPPLEWLSAPTPGFQQQL